MAIAFTRALPVSPGEAIASRQLANLAKAFNDRLRSGLGDGTWRIHFMMLSLFRGIRNRADEFTFASELEFFWYYQTVDPVNAWPAAPAGEPEGINVTNPIGAFVFGNASAGIFSEASHVNDIPTGTVGMSPLNGWDIAREQRGAVDPSLGSYAAPMLALARRANIGITGISKVGLSYGSWMKLPGEPLPLLFKPESKVLLRSTNTFAREFRGSDGQRASDSYHLQEAFDCQRFFSESYRLSPNYGVESAPGDVDAIYPLFTNAGATSIGQRFEDQDGATLRFWHPNFLMDGWRVTVTGATAPVGFMIEVGGIDFVEVNLTPDGIGHAADVSLLPVSLLSTIEQPLAISVRLTKPLPDGEVEVEFTELEARRPEVADLYAVLRCGSADQANLPDGVGTQEDQARVISQEYFRTGCVVNPRATAGMPEEGTVINSNAVFDAVRRFSQAIAISRRNEFVDYAVESGKSILWFKREFGIGEGVMVRPLEGLLNIKHAADAQGMTNEWILDVELRPYDISSGDIFKPEAYSDIYSLINRCHFDSPEILREAALLSHIAYGTGPVYVPESPPGWNYTIVQGVPGALNVNTLDCGDPPDPTCVEYRKNFYRSCRIYEPPVEVERVDIEGTGSSALLKVTLTGRLHHCAEAPASIPRSRALWDISALRAEPYRSMENGLREYLHQFNDGGNQCTRPGGAQVAPAGNSAINAGIWEDPTRPFGTCYPVFHWTRLVPFPYQDANDTQEPTDTHFTHDAFPVMEFYLRAMCEGYVDGETTLADACDTGVATLYDYQFQDLCQQAFGNSRIAVLPNYPDGYGPLPNTDALAAVYNQFVHAVNRLTRVRVMLPSILECNTATEDHLVGVGLVFGDGSAASCGDLINAWGSYTPGGPRSPAFADTWAECGGGVTAEYTVSLTDVCLGSAWELRERTVLGAVRFSLRDPDSLEAIPESWRDMWSTNQEVLLRKTTTTAVTTHGTTSDADEATKCVDPDGPDFSPAFPTGGGEYLVFSDSGPPPSTGCEFMKGTAIIRPEDTGTTDVFMTHNNLGQPCTSGGAFHAIQVEVLPGQTPTLTIPLA